MELKKIYRAILQVVVLCGIVTMGFGSGHAYAKTVAKPEIRIITHLAKEYKLGEPIKFGVYSPNYSGKVQYRFILENVNTKKRIELYSNIKGYYNNKLIPTGKYVYNVSFPVSEPGTYNIIALVKKSGTKVAYDSYKKTTDFTVAKPNNVLVPPQLPPAATVPTPQPHTPPVDTVPTAPQTSPVDTVPAAPQTPPVDTVPTVPQTPPVVTVPTTPPVSQEKIKFLKTSVVLSNKEIDFTKLSEAEYIVDVSQESGNVRVMGVNVMASQNATFTTSLKSETKSISANATTYFTLTELGIPDDLNDGVLLSNLRLLGNKLDVTITLTSEKNEKITGKLTIKTK
jgi:hypothetical protein